MKKSPALLVLKKKAWLSALLALSLQTPLRAETLLQLSHSPVDHIVAYQGQGIVTRQVKVTLNQPGDYQLRLTDIPLAIVGDSLHVSGKGAAGVVLHNVQLMPLPAGTESEALKHMNAQMKDLEARLARLENIETLNEKAQDWLDTYWERQEPEDVRLRAEDQQKTFEFLNQNQARILESVTRTALEKEALEIQKEELSVRLEELKASESHRTQAAAVYFSAQNKGEMTFEVSYLVSGIQWTPSYDARLDEKANKISLTYFGDLTQQTGESWKDVQLSLSTAVPQLNAAVPVLEPWILTDRLPASQGPLSNAPKGSEEEADDDEDSVVDTLVSRDRSGNTSANYAESDVRTQGLSVQFAIPQRVSIESAPHPRRVAIATRTFKYEPEYHVVPKVSSRVYLKARFRNTDNLPLLAGQIRNYVDQDYTGTSQLQLVRPNEEASLNFGVDESIRVTRKQGLDKTTIEGLMKDTRRRVMSYEVTVSNFKNEPVQVVVWDHLPVVQNEAIRMDVLQLQPAPTERSKDNLLKWVLSLKPQESKKIEVSYAVENPLSLEVFSNFTNEPLPARKMNMPQQNYEKF